MSKFILTFVTKIRGQITVEADNIDAAEAMGEEFALDTLNYDELSDNGRHAPDVETEFEDIFTVKENTNE